MEETYKNGLRFYFEYAGTGPEARCVHTWGDEGIYDHTLVYELEAKRTVVTNSLGHATAYQGNENGLVVEVWDARGGVTLTEYDEFNDILSQTDALGHVTTYTYDERGNCLTTQRPDGSQQLQAYDAQGRLVALVSTPEQQEQQWRYDEQGNLVQQTNPDGLETTFSYAQGLLRSRTNAAQQRTTLHYDAAHNLQEVRGTTSTTRTLYDGWGRPTKLIDARGNLQWRAYDLLNRVSTIHEPDGDVRRFTYDTVGNVTRAANRLHEVQYAYRGLSRPIRRTVAGTAVEFLYDTEEQLRGLLNEHGLLYRFELDALGQVVTETGFDGLQRRYTRDSGGQILELRLPDQQITRYAYDVMGRVTCVQYGNGSRDEFTYGLDGELLTATNATSSVRFERARADNLLHEIQGTHQVTSRYDTYGRRAALSSSLGAQIGYTRNTAGAVTQLQTPEWQATFERNDQGLEVQRQLSGGVRLEWQYDALGRPRTQRISTGGHPQVRQRHYSWQIAERLSQIEDNESGIRQFEHDARGNLARTRFNGQEEQLRAPDAVGNLFRTAARTDRRYGTAGQLLEAGGTRYTYDALGNLVRKRTAAGAEWTYTWNGAGQLASVLRPDGAQVAFTYDALGRRTSKHYRGQVTRWVWDGHVPLHEWQEPSEPLARSGDGPGLITWLFEAESFVPAARLTAQGASSIACDHLGTPLALYDGQGRQTWALELDSYGAVRRGRGQAQYCPFRYQGQYEDVETGLYYNRFRYYDPEAGQYISQNPIGLLGGSTLMSYVADPLVQIDPLGLSEGSGDLGRRLVANGDIPVSPMKFIKSTFDAHHLIPHAVWTDNQTFFDDIGLNHVPRKINPKDAIENGIMMPGTEAVGRQYGFDAYHSGGHGRTNDAMGASVEDIRDRFNALHVKDDTAKLAARLEIAAIQKAERIRVGARNYGACTMMP